MGRIVIAGGGICGLAAAMMLARDGHDVTVLEEDPAPVAQSPEAAWEAWERGGVTQFRQPHYLLPAGAHVLAGELPEVHDALLAARGLRFTALTLMPPWIADRAPRPGDERFATVTARRPTLEHVVAIAAESEPRVAIRRGVAVAELATTARDGAVHVTGARTTAGEELRADLVVDAMGRRSPLPRWLAAAGAPPLREEAEDMGFIYYSRFFRGDPMPTPRGPLLMPIGSFSLLTLPSDDGTWAVGIVTAAGDRPLKRVRDVERWTAVVASCPLQAPWLEGEALTPVLAMGGILDRVRLLPRDGGPAILGLALLGDACACTNPSTGRGMSLGLVQARCLRDAVREHLDDPADLARAYEASTEEHVLGWYRYSVRDDRLRMRQIEALRAGLTPPPPTGLQDAILQALPLAAMQDADVFRALLDARSCLNSPTAIFERPLAERIVELAAAAQPPPPAGPSRERLLALLA